MRRAKIVCTLGPAVDGPEQIRALVAAGMDVARLNLSHGSYAEHEARYRLVREAAEEAGRAVGVLVDLQGPKIRLGTFAEGPVLLERDDEFVITAEDVPGDRHVVSTTYKGLAGDVNAGDTILVDDGRINLTVVSVDGSRVTTRVVEGGVVSNNKGINLPGVAVSVPALSEKDIEDLRWALRLRADMIALSFVRNAKDAEDVHRIMDEEGVRLPVIAKPLVKTRAVELARRNAKPVIVATQMLESMISASRPTRAEASDVANAVLDGADALMLSGETSVGTYAIDTVRTMARIIQNTETHGLDRIPPMRALPHTKGGAITRAAVDVGQLLGAKFLVAFTQSGDSARRMSRLRPEIPLLAFTPDASTRSRLALTWGVETFIVPFVWHTDQMVMQVEEVLLREGRCRTGDLVVIVAGSPPGVSGTTNALRMHRVGDPVLGKPPADAEDVLV